MDPVKGPSYDVRVTPFQDAVGTKKPRWEWLEELIPVNAPDIGGQGYPRNVAGIDETKPRPDANGRTETTSRPEHELFGLAMLGGGKVFGTAHIYGIFALSPDREMEI